jgi:hypothetical protein
MLYQRIACKYIVIKLIDRHHCQDEDANIDMFPLAIDGLKLQIPHQLQYK